MKLQVPFPMIYLPRYMTMEPEAKLGFYGEFEVIKKRRGIITQVLKFRNVITDVGLQWMVGNRNNVKEVTQYCQLGTGTTTPTSSDTELQTYGTCKEYSSYARTLGSTNDRYYKSQFEFGLFDAIGTWTELGMSWTTGSGSSVFCRMLFKDDGGNPISIEKTSDDTMTIIYYLHVVRTSDVPTENSITVDGIDYAVQSLILDQCLYQISNARSLYVAYGNYARLGTGTEALSTTQTACRTPIDIDPTLYSLVNYVSGTFYREFMFEFPARITGNIAEFCFPILSINNPAHVAMRFPTPIPKTDTTKKIRLQPRITFARAAA
jgi:hypothetical protein